MHPEFRAAERVRDCREICCECGKRAEGNVACADGDICDDCHERQLRDDEIWTPCPAPTGVSMVVPPECAGQIVEESYSSRAHDDYVYRRFFDRSDRSARWECAHIEDFEEWAPTRRRPA